MEVSSWWRGETEFGGEGVDSRTPDQLFLKVTDTVVQPGSGRRVVGQGQKQKCLNLDFEGRVDMELVGTWINGLQIWILSPKLPTVTTKHFGKKLQIMPKALKGAESCRRA